MSQAWWGMGLVLGVFLALLLALGAYRRAHTEQGERTRKLVHVGMGCTSLALPWHFDSVWPVVALGLLSTALLLAIRRSARVHELLGRALDVERRSIGDLLFPASIVVLLTLSGGNALLFCAPVLLLTFADPVAAWAGMKYGQQPQIAAIGGRKTAQGSLAFVMVGAVVVLAALLALSPIGWPEAALISLGVALLAGLVEALSPNGLDNVLAPLAAMVVLRAFSGMPIVDLVTWVFASALAVGAVVSWRPRPRPGVADCAP